MDLEGRDYEELVKSLLNELTPSKIGIIYALLGPKCNVIVKAVDLAKDFKTSANAMKMFKGMLMNRPNMIGQEKSIKINSSGDENVEEVSGKSKCILLVKKSTAE